MILQMISMGLPDARLFPFIEPPSGDSVENSLTTLKVFMLYLLEFPNMVL